LGVLFCEITKFEIWTKQVNMVTLIEPKTKRLKLRQWCVNDRAPFAVLNANLQVMEFFPGTLHPTESDAMADKCESLIAERGWGFWAIEVLATGEFIGFVGLHIPTVDLPFSPCVEVGWRLACSHWGQGYATEAARASLQVGFEVLELKEIVSFASICNTRSLAVMERLNMTLTEIIFEHPAIPVASHLCKHCLYRISREDWMQKVE
jgi:RimJ/RimL family protein N-acetyltransferase